ncbi:MAG TPA: TrkA C-terminal domain-containing protein [Polyangiaceae bacterium]|nr:TrkA C-terminal domain-containing protein [Polyangiaceae bacterium]
MAELLRARPMLLLFVVAALGCLFGRLRVLGFSLGVAAVLFAGLLVGWCIPGIQLPDFVAQLGLVLFVYTLGLASGPSFFASLRLRGLRDNLLASGTLAVSAFGAIALARAFGLAGAEAAGVFAGALTNTPALAAVVETLSSRGVTGPELSAPVIACSICYPLGVLLPLMVAAGSERWFKVSYEKEQVSGKYANQNEAAIVNVTAKVLRAPQAPANELRKTRKYAVNFGRLQRAGQTSVVHDDTRFAVGDLVTLIGTERDVLAAALALGQVSGMHLERDRSEVDFRRMFVSNPELTERPIRELHLIERYDAVITRVRRGDVDLVPDGGFRLVLGDRARLVAPRATLHALEGLFGDSARRVAEVDVISFGLGIALGLLLGAVRVPVPGGTFSLGFAGGPLLVGLILGRLGRTGPLVWSSPYGANLTLRQFGLVLFLAGAGLQAGAVLNGALAQGVVLKMLGAGAVISLSTGLLTVVLGHGLMRIPLSVVVGMLAGIQTQPAVLAYALEKTGHDRPNVGYASVFPIAMITKILLAQLILRVMGFGR